MAGQDLNAMTAHLVGKGAVALNRIAHLNQGGDL